MFSYYKLSPIQLEKVYVLPGAAKLIVHIARVISQPVQTSWNFQEFTINIIQTNKKYASGENGQVSQNQNLPALFT